MIRTLSLMFFCLAGAASAQTVVIRSGEHGTFTRIALDMPYRADWRVEPHPDGAKIIFSDAELEFDTTRVFDRIGRNRLRGLKATRGQLHLDFACSCGVQAFRHADRMLVLDIAESFPSSDRMKAHSPALAVGWKSSTGIKPLSTATTHLSRTLRSSLPQPDDAEVTATQSITPHDVTFDLTETRDQLLRELGRASTQGLLTPKRKSLSEPVSKPVEKTSATEGDSPRNEVSLAAREPRNADSVRLNMRAQSSIDSATTSIRHGTPPYDPQGRCVPKDWLDVPSWAGTGAFHQQVGDLNRQLLREFDHPDKEIALKLARLYLYFGFGSEARHILDMRPERSEQDDILREMALIMDRGHAPDTARLATMAGCGEPAVLWALLAKPTMPLETIFDHKALLRAFAGLPASLRDIFGPELARRLIEARHSRTGRDILRMTERTGATEQSDLALARADLAKAGDDHDTAQTELGAAIANNSLNAPEALGQLIEGLLSRGAPVPLDKAELAGAYAYENRGTELGRRMTETYLAALGASGAFEKAVSEFDRLRPDLDAAGTAGIATSLMQQITRHGDDVTFLRHALSDHLITPDMVGAALGVDIAKRLLEAGLSEHAGKFVTADPPGLGARMAKLTRAEIALMRERPRQAEVELLGLEGPDANSLRAKARSLVGDHAAAQILYAASDQTEKTKEAAWLAEDLDQMAEAENPLLRQTAEILSNRVQEQQAVSDLSLEHHRGLLESAGNLRATMESLLDEKEAPHGPGT